LQAGIGINAGLLIRRLFLGGGEDCCDVALHFYLVPHLLDLAVRTDQEAAAHDSGEAAAHELLGAPDAVGFQHFVTWIADQWKSQLLLGAKCRQRLFGIAAGADDCYTELIEVLLCVTKLGRFGRSTRSIRFRKEKENDAPAFVGFQRKLAAFVRFQCEFRGFVADL
jgi:hypothetical protein